MNCHHEWCLCEVARGTEFCSEQCRGAAAEGEHAAHACACGHAGCTSIG